MMREGWREEKYLILFDPSEILAASTNYGIAKYLPGFQVVGLLSWDSLIVRDSAGRTYSVPAVPLIEREVEPFSLPEAEDTLQPDPRFAGKIKWYVQPLAFGGDAELGTNLTWVNAEEHAQLVKWWNDKYRSMVTPK